MSACVGKQSRLIGLEFGEKVNFRRTAVGTRMAKLDSLWSDGVFLGYRSIRWYQGRRVQDKDCPSAKRMSTAGGKKIWIWLEEYRGKHHQTEAEEGAIMPAIDIGMEMPEVEIPSVPDRKSKTNPSQTLH